MVPRPSNQQHRPDTKRRILLRPLLLLLPIPLLLLLLLPSANSVLLFRRRSRRPPRSLPPSSTRCRTRWIYDGFRRDFPRDSAIWTPSPPPRNEEDRVEDPPIRMEEDLPSIYRSGSVETQRSSLAGNIFEDFLSPSSQGRSLDTRVSLYPVLPFPPPPLLSSPPFFLFRSLLSLLFQRNSLDPLDRSRYLILSRGSG